ncbi:MAG: hypothetical protein ACP5JG_04465 [Anaerolineae bacterium]
MQPHMDTDYKPGLLFASANASVHFALACLEAIGPNLRAKSSFVDTEGRTMHWHDFGDLEGPGWAANAVGGAHLIYRWGRYLDIPLICEQALRLVDHVLDDGFICEDGFIWPYWDLASERFCLNYAHSDDWLCPGSLALIGVQMLEFARDLARAPEGTSRAVQLWTAAQDAGVWLADHVRLLPNGWVPRHITQAGDWYPSTPDGGPKDPVFDHSADGLFLLDLWTRLGETERALDLGEAFVSAAGFWGSINHDTYDDHEDVAYAVAFRALRRAASSLSRPDWHAFAYDVALPAMQRFRMTKDEHGVRTRGLFWMEESWDTAYLWENAEVAQAYLEAWREQGDEDPRDLALAILTTVAHHHYGTSGFLSEGIDWNNHVSQRHHMDFAYYGAIRYTEPLLNNLHLVGPTLTALEAMGDSPPEDTTLNGSLGVLSDASAVSEEVRELHEDDARLWLRLYHPAVATDEGVAAAIDFAQEAGIDGVWLFEASYDTDPALLTLETLAARFERLKEIVPRFHEAGLKVHINVMITMGHVDNGGGRPEAFDFQFLVDADGRVSRSTACPLDPGFPDYVEQIYRWAAACGADAVWVDDDVRFLGHDLQAMTCFCPHHLAEMTARTGVSWTRESLVRVLGGDEADPGIRQAWFDLQAAAMAGLAARVEGAVHGVDPNQRIGLMSVGTVVHNAEGRHTDRLLRTLSGGSTPDAGSGRSEGGTRPMLRPGAGFWHDWEPAAVLNKTEDVARQTAYLGRDVLVVAEIENHPYSPYQKSRRILALECAMNVLAGVHDLSLNILSSTGPVPFARDEVDYAGFLRSQRPFLRALRRACAGKRRLGIGVEATEEVARQMRLDGRPLMDWVVPRPWEIALARLGLPVGMPYDAPHLLSAETVWTDRYALGSIFQDGVVLTLGAVRNLLASGWGDRLGLRAVRPAPADVNEVLTADELNGEHAGVCLQVRHYASQLHPHVFDVATSSQARVLSEWVDLSGERRGPAILALELADGSRIGLLPFEIEMVTPALLQPARRDQWAELLAWIGRSPLPVRVLRGANVVPQLLVSAEGDGVLLALINLSSDDTVVELATPALGGGDRVERLTRAGRWTSVNDPERVRVGAWSLAVLRSGHN